MLIRDVIALYLRHSQVEGLHCAEALADRQRVLCAFAEACNLTVEAARPYHLTDFIEAHPGWRSVSTRRAKANYVRAAFAWALRGERIARNPFASVRYVEAERRPDMPDATLGTIEKLANKRFELALRFLRLTGCRLTELCEATWADVDLERGIWTIPKHKGRKHTQKPKRVALVAEAVAQLGMMAGAHALGGDAPLAPGAFVFLNNRGTPWNRITLGQHLRRMKKRHGIQTKATLHGIRHRFGSAGVANGAPIKLVSMQLGHSTVAVTERYYVNLDGEMEAIRAAAELAVRQALPPRPPARGE